MSDAYYGNVVAHFHFEGANGATTTVDQRGHTLNYAGATAPTISTTQFKFGTSALALNGSNGIQVDTGVDCQFGAMDFTAEAWIYPNSVSGTYDFLNTFGTTQTNSGWYVQIEAGGALRGALLSGGTTNSIITPTGSIVVGQWQHVAFCRQGQNVYLFVNGVLKASATNWATVVMNAVGQKLNIGAENTGTTAGMAGYIDEVRVTKGVARYVAAFTPPTAAFDDVGVPVDTSTGDPYWLSTRTTLHFDGANGSQTIVDTSPYPKAFAASGATSAAVVSNAQSKFGGTSVFLNGGYWQTAASTDFAFAGDFTIEFWAWKSANASGGFDTALTTDTSNGSATNGWFVELSTSRGFAFVHAGAVVISGASVNPNDSAWHHYAICRQGNVLRMFRDGVIVAQQSNSTSFLANGPFGIGGSSICTTFRFFGYMDDLRITKGVGRYTEAFTPPAQAHIDALVNTVQASGTDAQFANVMALLKGNWEHGSKFVQDMSSLPLAYTATNEVTNNALQAKWGAGCLDITSAMFVESAATTAMRATTTGTALTVEFWIKPKLQTTNGALHAVASNYKSATGGWHCGLKSIGTGFNVLFSDGVTDFAFGGNLQPGTWYHVAFSGTMGSMQAFVDGVQVGAANAFAGPFNAGKDTLRIGGIDGNTRMLDAYVDELRVTMNVARYTSNFTPLTAPFPHEGVPAYDASLASTVTVLHANGAQGATSFSDTSPKAKAVGRVGNPTVSTVNRRFGSASIYLNGATDYLTLPASDADLGFGTGDFTLECWIFPTSFATSPRPIFLGSGTVGIVQMYITTAGLLGVETSNSLGGTAGTVNLNQWNHIAVSRQAGTVRLFLNGALTRTHTDTNSLATPTTPLIGNYGGATSNFWFAGWIDEVRITKGLARYTAGFVPNVAETLDFLTKVMGTIKDSTGAVCVRTVRVYKRGDGTLIGATQSAADGTYSVNCPDTNEVQVVVLDDDAGTLENDLIARAIPA